MLSYWMNMTKILSRPIVKIPAGSHHSIDPGKEELLKFLLTFLNRKKYLVLIQEMLGTVSHLPSTSVAGGNRNTNAVAPPVSHSQWPRVLTKVGRGKEGGSPVFMVLQAHLASWLVESNSNAAKKRKRQETDYV
jgi:hypothetical protein